MKTVSQLSLLLALSSSVFASPVKVKRAGYAVKETAPVPRGWQDVNAAHGSHVLNLQIALKQSDINGLKNRLMITSDPDHAHYGQHLTADQVDSFVRPAETTVEAVKAWFAEHGLGEQHVQFSAAQDWAFVRLPVEMANYMLDTEYRHYTKDNKDSVLRVDSYSLPLHLHEHIDTIQPTTYFSTLKPLDTPKPFTPADFSELADGAALQGISLFANNNGGGKRPTFPSDDFYCNQTISVQCLRDLYGTSEYTANPDNGNRLGITAYLEEVANRKDLQTFLSAQRPEAEGTTFTEYLVNGGLNPQFNDAANSSGTIEAALDIQFASGIAYPTPVDYYSTGGRPPSTLDPNTSETYLEWLNFVLQQLANKKKVPQTISTSYGDDESSVPQAYAERVCDGFAQLTSQGITLFFSSGDAGVGPANLTDCKNQVTNVTQFLPSFPASCPWVTTVGGTVNVPNERAVARFPAGGGFSNYFPMPDWQQSTVTGYLAEIDRTNSSILSSYDAENLFNRSGRAYPDLAGQADRYAVYVPGFYNARNNATFGWGLIGGTSASSPAVAAIFSQVNDYLIEHGKPTLGFMNPLLYKKLYPTFTDITVGSSSGCGTIGFPALPGWDGVTGFGTPNFKALLELL